MVETLALVQEFHHLAHDYSLLVTDVKKCPICGEIHEFKGTNAHLRVEHRCGANRDFGPFRRIPGKNVYHCRKCL